MRAIEIILLENVYQNNFVRAIEIKLCTNITIFLEQNLFLKKFQKYKPIFCKNGNF